MTETRAKSVIFLLGDPLEDFEGRMLPTSMEVLRVYFHRHLKDKLSQKDAAKTVVEELSNIWARARIPISEQRNIVRKLESLVQTYRNICRNKKRGGDAQLAREANFVGSINLLFDVAHNDALNEIKIEEDKLFLMDQRSVRKYVMAGVDTKLAKKEEKRERRHHIETQRLSKEEAKRKATEAAVNKELSSSSNDTDSDSQSPSDEDFQVDCLDQSVPSTSTSRRKRVKVSASEVVSPSIASVLDRTNVSDRKAAFLLSAAAQTYNPLEVSKFSLSVSSIRRVRAKHRSQQAAKVKEQFQSDGPLVIHFDGKLLPAISGGPEKEDRVAVIVTGHEVEKILGVPKVNAGTGELIAQAAHNTLLEWKLQDQIAGISFDTTASNTGRLNGACVRLEKILHRKLLWLACRHHILEVVCGDVFKAVFGPTAGPNVLLFRRFQEYWPTIIQKEYKPCNDSRLNGELLTLKTEVIKFSMDMLQKETIYLPREDYRELLELSLIFLGEVPPRGANFRVPGAFHHARWMSKLLYVLKIYLFRQQFHLTAREEKSCLEFGLFVVLIYLKPWITCPIPCDAPINDLNLIQTLKTYNKTSEIISTTGIKAMSRHLWYLGQEMAPLGLFSNLVSNDTKQLMVARLLGSSDLSEQEQEYRSVRYTETEKEDLCTKTLDSFIGPSSHLFFELLGLDTTFYEKNVNEWEHHLPFLEARKTVMTLKVVNDSAERGIALATTFNSSITKQEEQKQFLLQVVENHRRRFPDARKRTLLVDTNV